MTGKLLTSALVSVMMIATSASAEPLAGQASILDGDTLEMHGARIRLWGIDAPESNQLCRNDESALYRCGAQAANDLDAFIARSADVPCSQSRSLWAHGCNLLCGWD
jgi:endonuclease YncB( thermonuclease family)